MICYGPQWNETELKSAAQVCHRHDNGLGMLNTSASYIGISFSTQIKLLTGHWALWGLHPLASSTSKFWPVRYKQTKRKYDFFLSSHGFESGDWRCNSCLESGEQRLDPRGDKMLRFLEATLLCLNSMCLGFLWRNLFLWFTCFLRHNLVDL